MLSALPVLAAALAALAVLALPGLPAVLALRLRPLTALASLAPFSLLVITLAAETGRLLGVPWTPLSPLVLALALGAALWPLRRFLRPEPALTEPATAAPVGADRATSAAQTVAAGPLVALAATARGRAAVLATGLLIGGGTIAIQALSVMGSVRAVSQTYDGVFHLSAVRHILRMGDASAWTVGGMTALPGVERYYPSLWHQTVSLATQLSGQEIPLVTNLVMLLAAAVVWPLG